MCLWTRPLKIPHRLISRPMNCNCGLPQFAGDPGCCTPTGMSTSCSKNCTSSAVPKIPGRLGSQRISQRGQLWDHNSVLQNLRLENLHDPNKRDIDHLIEALRNLYGLPQTGPWGTASAAQQGYRRPSTNCNYGATTVFAPSNGHVHNLVQELHELQATAMSGPWFLSLQKRATNNLVQEPHDNARILHCPNHGTCR